MTGHIPSLNWLRVFEAAARMGSFARAAERLAMSRPAVSQQIRSLEAHLGRPLFKRAAAGVTLTEAGRGLLAVVGESLGRMEEAAAAVSSPTGPPLAVGVSLTLSAGWLAPRLPSFLSDHPDTMIELHSMVGWPETPPRHAALWIAFGSPAPGTNAVRLFGERLVPVAHPDLADRIQTPDDFLSYPLIEVSDHRKNWAQVVGSDVLPASARVTYVDTTLTALALAASSGGIALARPPASDNLVKRYGLVPCLPGFELAGVEEYNLLCPVNASFDAKIKNFHTWIVKEANKTRRKESANRAP